MSLLKPWREDTWREEAPAHDIEIEQEDDGDFEIERVLRWRYYTAGNQRKKEYLVTWKGYPLDDATWLALEDIRPRENFMNMIDRDQPMEDRGQSSGSG